MSPAMLPPPPAVRVPAFPAAAVVGPHAARVARWLTRGGSDPPADPAAVLRGRGYLAPPLRDAVAAVAPDADAVALTFAVAAFPGKAVGRRDPASQPVADTELRLRVAAFTDVLAALPDRSGRPDVAVRSALRAAGRFPDNLTDAEADALAADLAATDDLSGGFLHLATLTAEQVARVVPTWRAERVLVRFVRTALLSPPSQLGGRAELARLFPNTPADVLDAAVQLEADARAAAGRVIDSGRVADAVAAFWEETVRDRLRSGFPYYAFRARFRTWWNQCLLTHPWPRPSPDLAADPPAAAVTETDAELDLLRVCREVFRVVRTTFFVRSADDGAGSTDEYRRAVDAVWGGRLERAADGAVPVPFEAIRADFPWLTSAAANNLSHRVRMRVLAGVKARVDRWRNAEILGLTTPARMRAEPAVPTVATVCRAALPTETLVGAFAAHAWLGGVVRPRHAEPPTAAWLVAELRHWAGAAGFRDAVRRGAENRNRTDGLVHDLFDGAGPVAEFVRTLASGAEVDATVTTTLADLLVDAGARSTASPERLKAWARRAGHEWVVPVWFLAGVERRPTEWVAARLLPDDDVAAAVGAVAREVAAGYHGGAV